MGIRDDIRQILPEIDQIQDAQLRDNVVATWEAGLARGGWTPKDMQRMPFTLAKEVTLNFAQHVRSVTRICLAVADTFDEIYRGDTLKLDRDILLAGALLHDVGALPRRCSPRRRASIRWPWGRLWRLSRTSACRTTTPRQ